MSSFETIVADLHLHSPYARAVSPQMTIPELSRQAQLRGIDLLACADWTHPRWFQELEQELEEWSEGVYQSRANPGGAKCIIGTEVSLIFSQGGKGRRVHLLVYVPSLEIAAKVSRALTQQGANLSADGRPIMGLSCMNLAEVLWSIDERCLLIPAHAWTPWFGIYGSKSGFDSLQEAFGQYAERIYAIETGLSSDPLMNWRIPELDQRRILSFSDAHSPSKLGRELTVFHGSADVTDYTYQDIYGAIVDPGASSQVTLAYTIEFYPEEGKYHWDGHRTCGVVQPPSQTRQVGSTCPVCGRQLTVGVEFRVDELAATERLTWEAAVTLDTRTQLQWRHPPAALTRHVPFLSLVPLQEIIAMTLQKGFATQAVQQLYQQVVHSLGSELAALVTSPVEELTARLPAQLAQAILAVRRGEVTIEPGYDGVYGTVSLSQPLTVSDAQASLF